MSILAPATIEVANIKKLEEVAEKYHVEPAAVRWAAEEYENRSHDGEVDTLDQIEEPVNTVLELLADKVNQRRLFTYLWGATARSGHNTFNDASAVANQIEESWPSLLKEIRSAAHEAHALWKRGKGNPGIPVKFDVACRTLAREWQRAFGQAEFTSKWHRDPKTGLTPTSPAARFMFDAMCAIDPHYPKLAENLNTCMQTLVSRLPGPRRGRKFE